MSSATTSTTTANTKSNYAFEIRFVDDNIVQVFDIAAKRQQQDPNSLLPTEYKQDDVLKGHLRYSKLVGSAPSTHQKDTFGLEDDGQPYKHTVTTKRSKNRRSIQRHTFFMMGGGGSSSCIDDQDVIDMAYDSGTAVSEEEDEDDSEDIELSNYLTYNQEENQIRSSVQRHISEDDSSHSTTVSPPTVLESSIPDVLPPPLSLPNHQQQLETEPITSQPLSPQVPKMPEPVLAKRTSLQSRYGSSHNNDHIPNKENNHYPMDVLPHQLPVVSPQRNQPALKPYAPPIQEDTTHLQQQARFDQEDYSSLTAVETNGHDSRQNMNQDHVEKLPKRGCCCIIS